MASEHDLFLLKSEGESSTLFIYDDGKIVQGIAKDLGKRYRCEMRVDGDTDVLSSLTTTPEEMGKLMMEFDQLLQKAIKLAKKHK